MASLSGKVALVTGATSGIGAAIAREAATAGAVVALTGRSAERGEAVRRDCGTEAVFIAGDLAKPNDAERIVDEAVRRFGRIDVLVNNAGILFYGTVEDISDEQWERTFAVNVTGVFRMSRAAIPSMKRRKSGAIVNISSESGLFGYRGLSSYCASKGAVSLLTKCMALDYGSDGIRVNAVCPGAVDTEMLNTDPTMQGVDRAAGLRRMGDGIPMGRVSEPAEIAKVVVFVASDEASYMTGAMVSVDGGTTAI